MHVTFRVTRPIEAIPDARPGDALVYHPKAANGRLRLVRVLPAFCEAGLMDESIELVNHSLPLEGDPQVVHLQPAHRRERLLPPHLEARIRELAQGA